MISQLANAHLLQTAEWAAVKQAFGWEPLPLVWTAPGEPRVTNAAKAEQVVAASMVLKKPILRRGFASHLCVLYVPKAPLLDWTNAELRGQVLRDLQVLAVEQRAIFLKIDPDVVLGTGVPGDASSRENASGLEIATEMRQKHWIFSGDQIQFRNTVLIDLTVTEESLLARMKQKTRYNVRLAEKKGVTVRIGTNADLPMLYRMYAATAGRDGFVIRSEPYYRTVWEGFMGSRGGDAPAAEPLIAEVEGEPAAAIFVFYFAGRSYYLYGMSREAHREKMPNHLLQWVAMRRAKARGCRTYDLWGAPDEFTDRDPLWGVFRFKEGLGGEVVRTLGAWDFPAAPFWYPVYTRLVPRILGIMRARGTQRIRRDLSAA